MNTYEMKLKQLGRNVAKAFALATLAGLVISICAGFFAESFGNGIGCTLAFGIVLGSIGSLFTTVKSGTASTLANAGIGFVKHLMFACLGAMGTLSPIWLVIGAIGLMISAGVGLVMILFLAISFPLTLLYLIIMTVLERMERLPGAEVTLALDKVVPVVCGAASVVITFMMFGSM